MAVLRKLEVDEDTVPVLFVFDEAGNIPIHGLKEMLGVGRGRKVGIILDYQNLPQLYAQYGVHGGNAILGSVGTMVFLPGLDKETTHYAAERVGKTTVLQHTSVDAPGKKYDNEREAETQRDLADSSEVRRLVRHKQAIAIVDSAPPIKFRYPPMELRPDVLKPEIKGISKPLSLSKAENVYGARSQLDANGADRPQTKSESKERARQGRQDLASPPEKRVQVTNRSSETKTVRHPDVGLVSPPLAITPLRTPTEEGAIEVNAATDPSPENPDVPEAGPGTQPPASLNVDEVMQESDELHGSTPEEQFPSRDAVESPVTVQQFSLNLQEPITCSEEAKSVSEPVLTNTKTERMTLSPEHLAESYL